MKKLVVFLFAAVMAITSCKLSSTHGEPSPKWKVKNVNTAKANQLIRQNKEIIVLDVRTPEEFAEGHIPGAVNIDFKAPGFAKKVAKLDRTKNYLLHCRSGNRSSKSLPILKQNGLETIYHLDKGFNAWKAQGLPVAR